VSLLHKGPPSLLSYSTCPSSSVGIKPESSSSLLTALDICAGKPFFLPAVSFFVWRLCLEIFFSISSPWFVAVVALLLSMGFFFTLFPLRHIR